MHRDWCIWSRVETKCLLQLVANPHRGGYGRIGLEQERGGVICAALDVVHRRKPFAANSSILYGSLLHEPFLELLETEGRRRETTTPLLEIDVVVAWQNVWRVETVHAVQLVEVLDAALHSLRECRCRRRLLWWWQLSGRPEGALTHSALLRDTSTRVGDEEAYSACRERRHGDAGTVDFFSAI